MIELSDLTTVGRDLNRPECVLSTSDGDFFVSHRGHGVSRICADGTQLHLAPETSHGGFPLLPNGIALRNDGSFLIANISDAGGIFELNEAGVRPFITKVNGDASPPINFVIVDEDDRIWFSVSSTFSPRHLAYRRDVKNGYVGIVEDGKARIVLEGLHYTNEIRPDIENGWLYVSETFSQLISRFPLRADGTLGKGEVFAHFPKGAFVDGIALDEDGGLWAACIVSNELYHIPKGGIPEVYFGERNPSWVNEVEQVLNREEMDRTHFDHAPTSILRNIASVAFHGSALDQLCCGCLLGDKLVSAKAPVKGKAPVHWDVKVPHWGTRF